MSARRENRTEKLDGFRTSDRLRQEPEDAAQIARAVRRFADRCLSNRCGRAAVAAAFGDFRHLRVACYSAVKRQQPRRRSERLRSRRRVVVSDPRTIRSITLNLAADGYEGRQEELATQPGSTTSFRLALVRSQPNGFDSPAAEQSTKAQTPEFDGFGFQVATAKSIEPKPKPQELSHDTDSPETERPTLSTGTVLAKCEWTMASRRCSSGSRRDISSWERRPKRESVKTRARSRSL